MTALERALKDPPRVPGLDATSMFSGLARREVSRLDILSQSVAAIGPASGALIGTVAATQIAGRGAWLAVLLSTVLAWSLAQVFGQFASRLAGAGSLYTFVARVMRPAASLSVLVALAIAYASIAGFGLTQTAAHLWQAVRPNDEVASPGVAVAVLVGVAALVLLILTRGVRVSTRVTLVAEAVGLLLLIAFVTLALVDGSLPEFADFSLEAVTPWQILAATGVMTGAMLGFESSAALGAEASRPLASIPRAMTRSVVIAGVLYLFMVVAGAASGADEVRVGAESIWIAQGLRSSAWLPVVHMVLALCFFPVALAAWTALSRLLFLTGREGTMPPVLGVVHARSRVPRRAVVVSAPLALAVPLLLTILPSHAEEAGDVFVVVATPLMLTAYALTCFAVPVFLRRVGEHTAAWTVAPIVVGVAVTVVAASDAAAQGMFRMVTGAVVILCTAAAGTLWAAVLRRRRGTAARLGTFDQTVQSDAWSGIGPR